MSLPFACPRCSAVIESSEIQTGLGRCPTCGCRLRCPSCGSMLTQSVENPELLHCSTCNHDLMGDDTVDDQPAPRLPPGSPHCVPGFELIEVIGRGGMGIVYRAMDLSLKREVAIKVLPPVMAADAMRLERFRNEAFLASRIANAHIVPIHEIRDLQGVPVIVMPYIRGSDLGKIIRHRWAAARGVHSSKLHPWAILDHSTYLDHVLPVCDELIDAVEAIHDKGVLHRDIKPGNVLIDERGRAWVSDFGLARLVNQGMGTQAGAILGTRGYMSPEQERGSLSVDWRTDVYGLGATLHHALTLKLPRQQDDSLSASRMSLAPQVSGLDRFEGLLSRALALDPAMRFGSVHDLNQEWKRVRHGGMPIEMGLSAPPRKRRLAKSLVAVICLVALLGGVLSLFWLDRDPVVHIVTNRFNSRVAIVPVDARGRLEPDNVIRPSKPPPLSLRLRPGRYLIVVDDGNLGFHEVYRTVPDPSQKHYALGHPHKAYRILNDGVHLHPITTQAQAAVRAGMAFLPGEKWQTGDMPNFHRGAHEIEVADFFLDCTEVTIEQYEKIMGKLPATIAASTPRDTPVTSILYDEAVAYAEKMGKRLPTVDEYEAAATGYGKHPYPWGENAALIEAWPIGRVGIAKFDKTSFTNLPILGLYSNVTEIVDPSWRQPPRNAASIVSQTDAEARQESRVGSLSSALNVCGGPNSVTQNHESRDEKRHWRHTNAYYCDSYDNTIRLPGLGFRCAVSAKPRFLPDTASQSTGNKP